MLSVSRPDGVQRVDGYAPIASYAPIGDGRAVGLVSLDGAIDWLCAPDLDSPSVFGALLDPERGGQAVLRPAAPFEVGRAYVEGTNILATTFRCADGTIRVTDALGFGPNSPPDTRTVLRAVDCLEGSVELDCRVTPRPGYGETTSGGARQVRVQTFGLEGGARLDAGDRGLLAFGIGESMPPARSRDDLEAALEATCRTWKRWHDGLRCEGPWRDAVRRSALVLKLLTSRRTGAIAAAATTSLPEEPGGSRNWDYRYSWVRDSVLALDALFAVGDPEEAQRYFGWLSSLPERESGGIGVLYSVSGETPTDESELPLAGWRHSRPVRIGNGAASQLQLGTYGTLLHAWHLYERNGLEDVDGEARAVLARTAVRAASLWEQRDAGIWEVRSAPRHFTQSKMMCAIGLDSAAALARDLGLHGVDPDALERERDRCIRFVEERCVDPATGVYRRAADGHDLDAAVLMALGQGYARWAGADQIERTIAAIQERLSCGGALLRRYTGEDGVGGREGAFLPCSFWLAGTLARTGRAEDAAAVIEDVLQRTNDVGILSEELWPDTGELVGNVPQALTHASLISAAVAVRDALASRPGDATQLWRAA